MKTVLIEIPVTKFEENISCKHSYSLEQGGSGSGPSFHFEHNICVCRKCGSIKVSGHEKGHFFEVEFHLTIPDTLQKVISYAYSIYPEHFKPKTAHKETPIQELIDDALNN